MAASRPDNGSKERHGHAVRSCTLLSRATFGSPGLADSDTADLVDNRRGERLRDPAPAPRLRRLARPPGARDEPRGAGGAHPGNYADFFSSSRLLRILVN